MQMDFEKAETILATILLTFSFDWTTIIFQLGIDIDKSNYFMDFKRRKKVTKTKSGKTLNPLYTGNFSKHCLFV